MDFVVGQQYLGNSLGDTNNSVLITLGDNLSGDIESSYAQLWQQVGFCSLPPNSVPGQAAAECLTLIDGSNRYNIMNTRHVNSQVLYANMQPGDTIMYGSGPDGTAQARVKTSGTGIVSLMTSDTNDDTGNSISFSLTPTALSFFAPWGKMIFDASGFHVTTASGASFHLGNLSAGVGGVGFNNYCQINSDLISISGSTVKIGNSATYAAAVLAPTGVSSLAPGTPTTAPVVVPTTNLGITSTTVFVAN